MDRSKAQSVWPLTMLGPEECCSLKRISLDRLCYILDSEGSWANSKIRLCAKVGWIALLNAVTHSESKQAAALFAR
jgi:hypothetical protein